MDCCCEKPPLFQLLHYCLVPTLCVLHWIFEIQEVDKDIFVIAATTVQFIHFGESLGVEPLLKIGAYRNFVTGLSTIMI